MPSGIAASTRTRVLRTHRINSVHIAVSITLCQVFLVIQTVTKSRLHRDTIEGQVSPC